MARANDPEPQPDEIRGRSPLEQIDECDAAIVHAPGSTSSDRPYPLRGTLAFERQRRVLPCLHASGKMRDLHVVQFLE
jgi:hypothetical protein